MMTSMTKPATTANASGARATPMAPATTPAAPRTNKRPPSQKNIRSPKTQANGMKCNPTTPAIKAGRRSA